jgi:acyl transferase domain-containing protein
MTTVAPDLSDGIAIVGLTGRFPGASSIEQFWENLRNGVESITFRSDDELRALGVPPALLANPRYVRASTIITDVDLFDAGFFGFNPREAELIDPQQRLFLECCWEVLEQAGYDPEAYAGLIGVYAGIGYNAYAYNVLGSAEAANVGGYQVMIGNDKDFLTTRVSYKLNLKGPSVVVQTACSTSLVAVYQACESLQSYRCDMALAGGVSINVHDIRGYVHQDGMILSPDGHCRAFDAKARGTVSGKGLGVVVLKRLADAVADGDTIHAVIKGWAINNDGSLKVGYTAPSVEGQAQVIAEALAMSNVPADTISYVEAHGTGTELGDPIEIGALNMAYRGQTDRRGYCAIGSLKTNMGHLDTAAGVAGLIKAALTVEKGELPPSLHYEEPNPQIDFADSPFFVNTALTKWETNGTPRRAAVSSFGIGGTNAHVILEQAPPVGEPQPSRAHQLLTISARSSAALDRAAEQLAAFLESRPDAPLPDVAHTLHVGRRGFDHRRVLVCRDAADAVQALRDPRNKRVVSGVRNRQGAACAFMFSGQGSQRVNMARALYEDEPVFRAIVDECAAILEDPLGLDLRTVLYPAAADAASAAALLTETRITQPALFVVEYALARLWMHWGISPVAMIGHSIGEYVAACLAGVFSLADALTLVAARGRLMQAQPAGTMLAVQMSAKEVQARLDSTLALAADNAPGLCVVAGEDAAIQRLEDELKRRNTFTRRLQTSHAFHSHMMDGALPGLRAELQRITLQAPQIPYISNVTGTWITAAQATDPEYWVTHLRQTVRFTAGIATLLASEVQLLLEVGPGNTLRSLASQQLEQGSARLAVASLPLLQEDANDQAAMLDALGRLWVAGAPVNWPAFSSAEHRRRIPLPTYPFERQRYWVEPKPREVRSESSPKAIQKRPDPSGWFYLPGWKRTLTPPQRKVAALESGECWILFDELKGLGGALAHQLALDGHDVCHVVPGRGFAPLAGSVFSLNLSQPDDYLKLLDELKALGKHPRRIVHLASMLAVEPPSFAAQQDRGFHSLLYLAQALGRRRVSAPVDVTVVSAGLHDVLPEDRVLAERCTLLGACTVIPQEYGNIWCRTIDFECDPDKPGVDRFTDRLLRELAGDGTDNVAYRGDARFVPTYEEAPVNAHDSSRFKTGGVYLITGGFGSLGLTLADHLARTRQARLVLTGRSVPPPRSEWPDRLAKPERDRTTAQILAIQYLESHGAEVLHAAADVGDERQVRAVVDAAEKRFGRLDGVIHAAGIVGGEGVAGVQDLTASRCALQFQPKVSGILALEKALEGRQLEVALLTSSISCELGGLGFAGYAAANHFLSAFAAARRKTSAVPWLALDFDGFRFGSDAGPKTALSDLLMTGAEGVDVVERALALDPSPARLVVSTANLAARINQYVKKAPPAAASKPDAAAAPAATGHARPELATAYEAPADDVEQMLARIWQELLGIDRVGRLDDFFELGGHSLLAVQVVSRVEQACEVQVSLRDIFEARTVADLADRIKTMKWLVPGQAEDDLVEEREEIEI